VIVVSLVRTLRLYCIYLRMKLGGKQLIGPANIQSTDQLGKSLAIKDIAGAHVNKQFDIMRVYETVKNET
jgi:hypothetical protein